MSARNIAIAVAVLVVLAVGGYYLMTKGDKSSSDANEKAAPASADGEAGAVELTSDAAHSEALSDASDASATGAPSEDPGAMLDASGDVAAAPYEVIEPADEEVIDAATGSSDVFESTEDDFVADGEPIADDVSGSGHAEDEPVEDPATKPNE